jgi:phage host-nuclease inhibitor protein Gam
VIKPAWRLSYRIFPPEKISRAAILEWLSNNNLQHFNRTKNSSKAIVCPLHSRTILSTLKAKRLNAIKKQTCAIKTKATDTKGRTKINAHATIKAVCKLYLSLSNKIKWPEENTDHKKENLIINLSARLSKDAKKTNNNYVIIFRLTI